MDVAVILNGLASKNPERLDWKGSIVDLMKLVGMDSSLSARKQPATELHYSGDQSDTAAMNVWLHKEVLRKLSENGGKVPQELWAEVSLSRVAPPSWKAASADRRGGGMGRVFRAELIGVKS